MSFSNLLPRSRRLMVARGSHHKISKRQTSSTSESCRSSNASGGFFRKSERLTKMQSQSQSPVKSESTSSTSLSSINRDESSLKTLSDFIVPSSSSGSSYIPSSSSGFSDAPSSYSGSSDVPSSSSGLSEAPSSSSGSFDVPTNSSGSFDVPSSSSRVDVYGTDFTILIEDQIQSKISSANEDHNQSTLEDNKNDKGPELCKPTEQDSAKPIQDHNANDALSDESQIFNEVVLLKIIDWANRELEKSQKLRGSKVLAPSNKKQLEQCQMKDKLLDIRNSPKNRKMLPTNEHFQLRVKQELIESVQKDSTTYVQSPIQTSPAASHPEPENHFVRANTRSLLNMNGKRKKIQHRRRLGTNLKGSSNWVCNWTITPT